MDECILSLGEAQILYTQQADSGYYQIKFEVRDRDKTAFTLHHGLYGFIVCH